MDEDQQERYNELVQQLEEGLDKRSITEMKSYARPPKPVQATIQAVLVLLGEKPEKAKDWGVCKAHLGELVSKVKDFGADSFSQDAARAAREIIESHSKESVAMVSQGATALFEWTDGVIDIILPDGQ